MTIADASQSPFLPIGQGARDAARAVAATFSIPEVRKRVLANRLARQVFLDWAADSGFEVVEEAAYADAPDVVEVLDVCDVWIAGRRVGVSALMPGEGRRPRVDWRALNYGYHADLYAFVELTDALDGGTLVGLARNREFVKEGRHRVATGLYFDLPAAAVLPPTAFAALLAEPPAGVDPPPGALAHEEVFPKLGDYLRDALRLPTGVPGAGRHAASDAWESLPPEAWRVPIEAHDLFEAHLLACATCRRRFIALRKAERAGSLDLQEAEFRAQDERAVIDLAAALAVRGLAGRASASSAEHGTYPVAGATGLTIRAPADAARGPCLTAEGRVEGRLFLEGAASEVAALRQLTAELVLGGQVVERFPATVSGAVVELDHDLADGALTQALAEDLAAVGRLAVGPGELRFEAST